MILEKDSFKDMFIFETNDLVQQLEEIIMENEDFGGFDTEATNSVFRIMHTIKGSASMMGLSSIASLAHALEDLFDYFRAAGKVIENPSVMDLVLEALDFIKGEVEKLSLRKVLDGDGEAFVKRAKGMLAAFQNPYEKQSKPQAESLSKSQEPEIAIDLEGDAENVQMEDMETRYKATVFYEEESGMESLRAFMLVQDMEDFCEDISHVPSDISGEECEEEIRTKGLKIYFNTKEPYDVVLDFLKSVVFVEKVELIEKAEKTKLPSQEPDVQLPAAPKMPVLVESDEPKKEREEAKTKGPKSSMISVNVEKLDQLMNLMGEIVISGMMVSEELLSGELDDEARDKREALCYQHEKIISDLQDITMVLRMVPMSVTFQKMRRVVRDMCRKLGCDVNFHVIGEETEIDKNVLDGISDPLLHLVRNAVDHGIGSPSDRAAAGKHEVGNVSLEARNVAGDVWIIVKDDGSGLDREKIYEKAFMKGLVTKPANEMTDAEVFSYIFKPGFSTNENVTEFSGRGVGLDVVMQNVSSLGGSVSVESKQGEGSSFIIKIPMTLAIIGGMAFKVGGNKYSMPISSVKECIEVTQEELILDPDGNEAVIIREECYPILRLHKRYNVETNITDITKGILIVIDSEQVKYCLFVDQLIGEQQVVVKSLPKWIGKKIKGISGCTLLGDGSISLILDAVSLVE